MYSVAHVKCEVLWSNDDGILPLSQQTTLASEECIPVKYDVDYLSWNRTHGKDAEIIFLTYQICDTMFGLLATNQSYSLALSSVDLKKWDNVKFVETRIKGLPFLLRTTPDAVVSTLKLSPPSAPAPEDPMDVVDMDAVAIHPSIALPVLSVRYTNAKVLTRQFQKRPVSELSSVNG